MSPPCEGHLWAYDLSIGISTFATEWIGDVVP
jgi:hypothetical protein